MDDHGRGALETRRGHLANYDFLSSLTGTGRLIVLHTGECAWA